MGITHSRYHNHHNFVLLYTLKTHVRIDIVFHIIAFNPNTAAVSNMI